MIMVSSTHKKKIQAHISSI